MSEKKILGVQDIKNLIPHRYPILLLDSIVEYELGVRALGHKCVTQTEPFLQGHFPDEPIMPGVLQVEAMAQLCAALEALTDKKGRMLLAAVNNVRFLQPVVPGMRMDIHVLIKAKKLNVQKSECFIEVDGVRMSEASITGVLTQLTED